MPPALLSVVVAVPGRPSQSAVTTSPAAATGVPPVTPVNVVAVVLV